MLDKFKKDLQEKKELYLRIKVAPSMSNTCIKNIMEDDTIKINISAIPEKGKANKELIKFLSKEFNVLKENISIISGVSNKLKLIKIYKS